MNDDDYGFVALALTWIVLLEVGVILFVAGMWYDATFTIQYATAEDIAAVTSVGGPIPLNRFLKLGGIVVIVMWLGSMFTAHIHYQHGGGDDPK